MTACFEPSGSGRRRSRALRRRRPLAIAAAAVLASVQGAAAEPVAVTFDDLPVFNTATSSAEARATTDRLLAGLRRAHIPATGFVNEGKLAGADRAAGVALLTAWLDAGMDLGNHGYSHLSLNSTPLAAYIADAAAGDAVTKPLLAARGKRERWWRYPFLQTGPTIAAKQGFEDWLRSAGYQIAPVTMETSDYLFADAYAAALARGDQVAAKHVRSVYLDYSRRVIAWYRQAALSLLGRRPAFVLLLHASRLNADTIDPLAGMLRDEGLRFVTLDKAMRDPAYSLADPYVGPDGVEWLERWSLTLHRDLPWSTLPPVPAEVAPAPSAPR